MTIRNVPTDYPSITAAAAASQSGDTILVSSDYAGNENATILVNNLTVSAPSDVSGIFLSLGGGVLKITLAGASDMNVAGNGANNKIYGNAGNNTLDGGTGRDHYYGSAGDDVFIGGGADKDIVDYRTESSAGASHGIIANLSAKMVSGGVVQDTVRDGFGDVDSIVGIRNLTGSKFADRIYGGGHDNVLAGGRGSDYIQGGKGADTLTGGTGADKFVFKSKAESTVTSDLRDDILDFSSAQRDKVNLHGMDADSGNTGNQDFTFIGLSHFSGDAGELRYAAVKNGIIVKGDVNGDGTADFAIHLANIASIGDTDFIL